MNDQYTLNVISTLKELSISTYSLSCGILYALSSSDSSSALSNSSVTSLLFLLLPFDVFHLFLCLPLTQYIFFASSFSSNDDDDDDNDDDGEGDGDDDNVEGDDKDYGATLFSGSSCTTDAAAYSSSSSLC